MKEINLSHLKLKTFTEQDVIDYCQINNLNPNNIKELNLSNNELTDISGIRLFKNLKLLYLHKNYLTDISVLKNLNKLEFLNIESNKITNISIIKNSIKLRYFYIGDNPLTDISVIQNLKINSLGISNLNLKSDQIKYINSVNTLKTVFCNDKKINNMLKKNILKI